MKELKAKLDKIIASVTESSVELTDKEAHENELEPTKTDYADKAVRCTFAYLMKRGLIDLDNLD